LERSPGKVSVRFVLGDFKLRPFFSATRELSKAAQPVFEKLEARRLFTGGGVAQPLPIDLNFSAPIAGTLTDSAGQGTGFTSVQPNTLGNQYQPALIQLSTAEQELKLTTTGTSAAGGSWEGDNSLVNGLQNTFNATTGAFTISTRLQGPLSYLASPSEQGGIMFGPNDDNYVKLVAVSQPAGQMLQMVDEQLAPGSAVFLHSIPVSTSYTSIGSFANIKTLDLNLTANPGTGLVTGSYAINGGAPVVLSQKLMLTGAEESAFFSPTANAGIIAMAKNNLAPVVVGFDNFSVTPLNTGPTGVPVKLTGTVIGTTATYRNHADPSSNVFDGNVNTFFDGADASGDWVGLNLGTPAQIMQVQYSPRAEFANRMVGGTFQASSSVNFMSGVVNLFTITAAPAYGVMTVQPVTIAGAYQYVRYIGPANSYCNLAELEFDGSSAVAAPPAKLSGMVFGTAGSYANVGNTIANVFDGNLNTFFDAPAASGDYVGEAFASEALVTQLQYAPRPGWASRMIGGIFQASVGPSFLTDVINLYTIASAPTAGVLTTVPISMTSGYKYFRYLSPNGAYGNVAEIEFDGTLTGAQPPAPSVANSSPTNGATDVDPTGFISCALSLPNLGAGVDPGTMTSTTVYLYNSLTLAIIPTEVNTDAVGSTIVLQPQSPLAANTSYTFVVTSGVTDLTGLPFTPYQITFTTGAQTAPVNPGIAFQQLPLPTATGQSYTCVTMGPDGDLYASTLTGAIFQFPINADGTLGTAINLTASDTPRLITGIVFDPSSTAKNMLLWISSGDVVEDNAPDFTGSISGITITGSVAGPWTDYVVGLPRSNSNHMNDQPVFGPDGALYFAQGSMSSAGGADSVWGNRPEDLLSAAILRLNIQAVEARVAAGIGPLNVQTANLPVAQSPYNPYAPGAPLTLYATGVRNAYDLIWDTNGHLYAPTNGASAGGNLPGTPAGVTPAIAAVNGLGQAEDDYLYNIVPGGYYGHPDPARGEYVYGGGNPVDPAADTEIQAAYPLGTNPLPNYQGYLYDFGVHYSPDGSIEYQGSAFGGALNGALLITEYSGGKDIVALTTGASGQITSSIMGITGFTGFTDPVDLIENPATGNIYVADLGAEKLVLLRPIASGAKIFTSTQSLTFANTATGMVSTAMTLTITNVGTQPLAIPANGLSLIGTDGALFAITSSPVMPAVIAAGASINIGITFNPGSASPGQHTAQLQIASNDSTDPMDLINLFGTVTV
jgi:glucose/arabinose dehydrogenase